MLPLLRLTPEVSRLKANGTDTTFNENEPINGFQYAVYLEDEIDINDKWAIHPGLRASGYYVNNKWYNNLQPRLSLRYLWNDKTSLKLSYNYLVQYLHLLTNSSLSFPTDLWVSATDKTPPQMGWQVAAGIFKMLPLNLELSVEAYYKSMHNQIEYQDGANYKFGLNNSWEDKIAIGQGESYGIEFYLKKAKGKVTGWAGYTLSWTNRQFDEINNGNKFPYTYDKRHDLSFLGEYNLTSNKRISMTFVLSSGNSVTLPEAQYQGVEPPPPFSNRYSKPYTYRRYISSRNGFKAPTYHRMDISYQTEKQKKKALRTWVFSLYNMYNHANTFFLYERDGKIKEYTMFPIIPSVTYRLEW